MQNGAGAQELGSAAQREALSAAQSDSARAAVPPLLRVRALPLSLYAAAIVTGVVIAACFLRFQLFPLAWLAFVPLLWALGRAGSPRAAARIGFVAGLVTNLP